MFVFRGYFKEEFPRISLPFSANYELGWKVWQDGFHKLSISLFDCHPQGRPDDVLRPEVTQEAFLWAFFEECFGECQVTMTTSDWKNIAHVLRFAFWQLDENLDSLCSIENCTHMQQVFEVLLCCLN